MLTERVPELSPGIARDLEERDRLHESRPPSFLNWVLEETDRLRARITPDTAREERFRIQNEIAALSGPAYGYGQWIYHRTHWSEPSL